MDRGFYTNVKGPKLEGDIDVDFSDIRKLQILIDKVKRIQHILQLNFEISHGIKSAIKSIKRVSVSSLAEDFEGVESKIDLFMTQHRIHISRLQSLIDRGQGIRAFVCVDPRTKLTYTDNSIRSNIFSTSRQQNTARG